MPRLKNPNREKFAQVYAKELINNDSNGKVSATKVYAKVYKAPLNSAASSGSNMLKNPNVQTRIQEIIAAKNSAEDISEDLAKLRKANKEVFDPLGRVVEVVDNATRLGAVQTCLKVANAFSDQPVQDNRQVNFNLKVETGFLEGLSQTIEKLAGLNEILKCSPQNPQPLA